MSNVHGLGAAKKARDNNDDGNEMFSQDGAVSGTGVLRPKKTGDVTNDIVQAARDQSQAGQQPGVGDAKLKIFLYRNGFKVGEDGEFRTKQGERNERFLRELREGNVPSELEARLGEQGGQNVRVDIVDKTQEDFVPPEPAFQAFTGKGFSMGGAAKPVGVSFKDAKPDEAKVDGGDGVTVMIVTHDGTRLREKFALSQTVLDIYQRIMFKTGKSEFDLIAGFPPKPLSDPSATIGAAGLKGAKIRQRLAGAA